MYNNQPGGYGSYYGTPSNGGVGGGYMGQPTYGTPTQPPTNQSFAMRPPSSSGSPFYTTGSTNSVTSATVEQQQLQRTRQLQADSVIKRFPNAKIVSTTDNNLLDVSIVLKNGQQLAFRILMQSTFPQQPPLITVMCTARHQNIDANGYVIHSQLRSWTPQSSLGDVLSLVFRDFIQTPPTIVSAEMPKNHITKSSGNIPLGGSTPSTTSPITVGTLNGTPTQPPYTGSTQPPYPVNTPSMPPSGVFPTPTVGNTFNQPPPQQPENTRVPLPTVPSAFPEIALLDSTDAVQQLLDNPTLLEQFIDNLSFTKEAKTIYHDLRNANLDIAKKNVEKDDKLTKLKEKIDQDKTTVDQLINQVQILQAKQQELSQKYAPPNLLVMLNDKIDEIDNESEDVGEAYLNAGVLDAQQTKEFTDKYLEKRALYYLRKQKRDRFKETYCKQ